MLLCYKLLPLFGIISSKVLLLFYRRGFFKMFVCLFCYCVDHLEFMVKVN